LDSQKSFRESIEDLIYQLKRLRYIGEWYSFIVKLQHSIDNKTTDILVAELEGAAYGLNSFGISLLFDSAKSENKFKSQLNTLISQLEAEKHKLNEDEIEFYEAIQQTCSNVSIQCNSVKNINQSYNTPTFSQRHHENEIG